MKPAAAQPAFRLQHNLAEARPTLAPALPADPAAERLLQAIADSDQALHSRFADVMRIDNTLTRQLVSFQANKTRARYRWYKYKEAFSADLVEYLLNEYPIAQGKILDPFAGAGTALFAAAALGHAADGIELLPVGKKIIAANILCRGPDASAIAATLDDWLTKKPWQAAGETTDFQVLRITDGAYPADTLHCIKRYLHDIGREPPAMRDILLFALLCVLEAISYTRKDGQYLRWDHRCQRARLKKPFDKGPILSFDEAITAKLREMKDDIANARDHNLLAARRAGAGAGAVNLMEGSCLHVLPQLPDAAYTGILTSPPYCNRYDYTRIYALELAILGIDEAALSALRQTLLTCTVENKAKELPSINPAWAPAIAACDHAPHLQNILAFLDHQKRQGELNNSSIARMVRGYFYEMACVIQECHRVLQKGGKMIMVNDNVKYAGAAISVDTLLSQIAQTLGFHIRNILVLPQHKGNSSQQMGRHGRAPLRKCVYVWEKRHHPESPPPPT